jgi:hypothetical protein
MTSLWEWLLSFISNSSSKINDEQVTWDSIEKVKGFNRQIRVDLELLRMTNNITPLGYQTCVENMQKEVWGVNQVLEFTNQYKSELGL